MINLRIMEKAEIPIRNIAVEVEMEVQDKQEMQSKTVDLLNLEFQNIKHINMPIQEKATGEYPIVQF